MGFSVANKEKILDHVREKKISDLIVVRNVIKDFFLNDLVIEGIQLDEIPFADKRTVDGFVIGDALFEAVDGLILVEVSEFRKIDFPQNACFEDFLVLIDAFKK